MTNAAIRATMTHNALVERDVNAGKTDNFNQPLKPKFQFHASFPVLATPETIREVQDGNKLVVISLLQLIADRASDIIEADRIQSVTDRLDKEVFAGNMEILSVEPQHEGYQRITVRRVKGS